MPICLLTWVKTGTCLLPEFESPDMNYSTVRTLGMDCITKEGLDLTDCPSLMTLTYTGSFP